SRWRQATLSFSSPTASWTLSRRTATNSVCDARSMWSGLTATRPPAKSLRPSSTRPATSPGTFKWTIGRPALSRLRRPPIRIVTRARNRVRPDLWEGWGLPPPRPGGRPVAVRQDQGRLWLHQVVPDAPQRTPLSHPARPPGGGQRHLEQGDGRWADHLHVH